MKKIISKLILISIIGILHFYDIHAQYVNWSWLNGINSPDFETVSRSCVDDNGNLYILGAFDGATTNIGGTVYNNAGATGTRDAFIIKYNSSGTILWVEKIGGIEDDYFNDVIIDNNGDIIVVGYFNSPFLSVGSFSFNKVSAGGDNDFFIAKFNSAGSVISATSSGDPNGSVYTGRVTVDSQNNIIVSGFIIGQSVSIGNYTIVNNFPSSSVGFFAKFSPSYVPIWVNQTTGNKRFFGMSMKVDINDNILIAGFNLGGPGPVPGLFIDTITTNTLGTDAVLLKLSSSGNALLLKNISCYPGAAYYTDMIIDNSNNIYMSGEFEGSNLFFDSTTSISCAVPGVQDVFVAKYDANADFLWVRSGGGANFDKYLRSISGDNAGNIYVAGNYYSYGFTFGSLPTISSLILQDYFIVKLDTSGNEIWIDTYGDKSNIAIGSFHCKLGGGFYLTGWYGNDTLQLSNQFMLPHSGGPTDAFVASSDGFTGLPDLITDKPPLKVSPNPANDRITVSITEGMDLSELVLYDVRSKFYTLKAVSNTSGSLQTQTYDISGLASGVYFLKIEGKETYVAKVVKY